MAKKKAAEPVPTPEENTVKILAFRVRNFMNIESAKVNLAEGVYELYGDNADGKTAFMEAILAGFSGKRGMVRQPVRNGAKSADWFVDTGAFTIERSLSASGSMKLTVTAQNGNVYPHGQAFLDAFIDSLAFDPNRFSRMEPAKQAEVLREIVGVDLSTFDQQIKDAEAQRLEIGRDRDRLKGQVDGCTWHEDAPKSLISVSKLVNELDKRQKANQLRQQDIDAAQADLEENKRRLDEMGRQLTADREELRRLETLAAAMKKTLADREEKLNHEAARSAMLKETLQLARNAEVADEDAIRKQLKNVEKLNEQVRDNQKRQELLTAYQDKKQAYEAYTEAIQTARRAKQEALAEAQFPVEGLSFDEAGVFYGGVPFEQISTGQKIRIGAQLFFARNPKLNLILVRDASLLDRANRAVIIEEAARRGAQVLLEIVGAPSEELAAKNRSFTITDGRVEFDGQQGE